MIVKRHNVYGCLVVGVLAGMGCGELGSRTTSPGSPAAERPAQVRTQSATLDGDEIEIEGPTGTERITEPDAGLVERVHFVPVESSGSSDEPATETKQPRMRDDAALEADVYDVSVRLDSDRLPEETGLNARLLEADTSSESSETEQGDDEDGDPVPLPADWPNSADTADGESADGDPVPLPANPESEDDKDGNSEDGDPVPLPAEWVGGIRETSDDGSSDDDSSDDGVETFRAEDTVLLVFSAIERHDRHLGSELVVELSSPAWSSALYLSVDG